MVTRQYKGARYVPIFDGDWDNTKDYDPLVIVSYQGNSYTSRTFVPHGTAITNETYWALTGNYNAQVEAYRQEVLALTDYIDNIDVYVTPEMFGAKGDGVTDDTSALQDCINNSDNKVVILANKTYIISRPLILKSELTIIGAGSDKTIIKKTTSTGDIGSITLDGITYDYTQGSILIAKVDEDTRINRLIIKGLTLDCNSVNNGILAPKLSYSNIDDIKINSAIIGINAGHGWNNVFSNIQVNSNLTNSIVIRNMLLSFLYNIQSRTGSLKVHYSNLALDSCDFDNGNPSYNINDSYVSMQGCYCETYNYPMSINASNVVINSGVFEKHASVGATPNAIGLSVTNGSKVELNNPHFLFVNNTGDASLDISTIYLTVNNSSVEGNATCSLPLGLTTDNNGYIKINNEVVSSNNAVENVKLITTSVKEITVSVPYRSPKVIKIEAIAQYYDTQSIIRGDIFVTNTGSLAEITDNTVTVEANSESNVPTVSTSIDGNNITVTISGSIQTIKGKFITL